MGMTIGEIIAEADERYPNGFSQDSKLRKINARERELFRTKFRMKTMTMYDILADLAVYPLDFAIGKVLNVVVNGEEYDYEDNDDDTAVPPYYYTYESAIVLFPTPTTDNENGLIIHHWYEPDTYTSESEIPSLDPDFHMLHVWGLLADMASINREFDVSNAYIRQYNDLIEQFDRAEPEPVLKGFRVER